jgi:peptide/nickel transport system substrate-binding protein
VTDFATSWIPSPADQAISRKGGQLPAEQRQQFQPPLRRIVLKRARFALAALAFVSLAFTTAYAQPRNQSFIVAQGADTRSLSPLSSTNQQEKNISNAVVERLIQWTPDGVDFVGVLATDWEQVADDRLRLTLRQGVSFHNGEPFNAESAAYSIQQMLVAPPYAAFVGVIDSVEVVDEYTIDLVGHGPTPRGLMLHALAMGSFQYPPAYTEEVGLLEGFATAPVGTGPFKFVEWVKDDRVVLQANPDYWKGKPGVEYLVYRPIAENSARIAALEAGDIDFAIDIPLDALARLDALPDVVAVSAPGGRAYTLTITTLDPESPLANVEVRRALQYAVDPDAVIEFMLRGQGERLTQVVAATTFGHNPDIPRVDYDPQRARQMLADAGYPNGLELNLEYPISGYPMGAEISQLIASQLEEAGVRVNQVVMEYGEYLNRLVTLRLQDLFYGGSLTPPDAQFSAPAYTCGFRYSYFCNERYDELFRLAPTLVDDEERKQAYGEMNQILFDQAAIIPLYTMNDFYAHREGLQGWVPMRDQFLDFSELVYNR